MHDRQSPDPPQHGRGLHPRNPRSRARRSKSRSEPECARCVVVYRVAFATAGGDPLGERFEQDGGSGVGGAGRAVAVDGHG